MLPDELQQITINSAGIAAVAKAPAAHARIAHMTTPRARALQHQGAGVLNYPRSFRGAAKRASPESRAKLEVLSLLDSGFGPVARRRRA